MTTQELFQQLHTVGKDTKGRYTITSKELSEQLHTMGNDAMGGLGIL